MNSEIQSKLTKKAIGFHLPRYDEITNVGLYLEQTVKLINAYLEPLSGQKITNTMVSNYVKHKLIERPIKKQYYTDHIVKLIFISIVKCAMTMEDIGLILLMQKSQYPLKKAYNYFCDEFENNLRATFGVSEALSGLGDTESELKELLRTAIIAVADKIYLDLYIDAYRDYESAKDSDNKVTKKK